MTFLELDGSVTHVPLPEDTLRRIVDGHREAFDRLAPHDGPITIENDDGEYTIARHIWTEHASGWLRFWFNRSTASQRRRYAEMLLTNGRRCE